MQPPRDDAAKRAAAKAAGYTDAEIDAFLAQRRQAADPYKPTNTPRIGSESTGTRATLRNATPEQVAANRRADVDFAKGVTRQAAQGATFGFADEIEAGARAMLPSGRPSVESLITGDPRGYRAIRDAIRSENDQFQQDHPGYALAANVGGGLLTGGVLAKGVSAVPMLARVGLAPSVDAAATTVQRVGQAAKLGAVGGAVGGAGVAPELKDVGKYAIGGGVAGGVLGGAFSMGADALRNARNAVASTGLNGAQPGPLRRLVQAESPEVAGVRRVLQSAGRGGQTADELVAASKAAPASKALFEVIPNNQGTRTMRTFRNVGRERDAIDRSLAERTAETPSRLTQMIADVSGVPEGLDAKIVGEKAFAAVEPRYDALVQKAYAMPDVSAKPILRTVEKLAKSKSGNAALTRARELSEGFDATQMIDPANPVISVQNAHYLRQGLDHAIAEAEKAGDAQMVRILMGERNTVDRFVKKAGGKLMQRADRLWERAAAEGESFAAGQQSQQAVTKGRMVQLKTDAKDPVAFRRGAASKQLERVEAVSDGAGGQTRNPTMGVIGNRTARARASLGYETPGDFRKVRTGAEDIVAEIASQRAVAGNSTTAANLAEMADEFMSDPSLLIQAPLNPVGTMKLLGERGGRMLQSGLNAEQATQGGRLLAAGLPGQMTRQEAEAILQRLAPEVQKQLFNQLVRRGAVSNAAVRGIFQPPQ